MRGAPAPRVGSPSLSIYKQLQRAETGEVDLQGHPSKEKPLGTVDAVAGNPENQIWRLPSQYHAKVAFALKHDIEQMAKRHGIAKLGFLTLTFPDKWMEDAKEAQRRYHSFDTGFLSSRYSEKICVIERSPTGRLHFHLIVALDADIRTGFDFSAVDKGEYRSASKALSDEWKVLRQVAKKYGFGRTELLPIKSTAEGIACYCGKYISKHINWRRKADKGLRLVRYSLDARKASMRFSFNSDGMRKWRRCLALWAEFNEVTDYSELAAKFGPHWAWMYRDTIKTFGEDNESRQEAVREFEAKQPASGRAYGLDAAAGKREFKRGLPSKRWNPGIDIREEISKEWAKVASACDSAGRALGQTHWGAVVASMPEIHSLKTSETSVRSTSEMRTKELQL